jgi:hypothetical protein
VQPTLLEGAPGSTVCYDAVALAVTSIVSYSVSRELDGPELRFFPVGDAAARAAAIEHVAQEPPRQAPSDVELLSPRTRCSVALPGAVDITRPVAEVK